MYNIGIDARPLSTSLSGVGRLIAETLMHFPDKENYRFILFSQSPVHKDHKKLLKLPHIQWEKGDGFLASRGGLYYNVYLPLKIRRYRLDLFWGTQQVVPPFMPKDIPVVLTFHDFVAYKFPNTMRFLARLQQKFFQRLSLHRADYIITNSQQTRQDLQKMFNWDERRSVCAYPGIDKKQIQTLIKMDPGYRIHSLPKKFFLSVSTIEPRKNYGFMLDAYKLYRGMAGREKLPWVIAGKTGWESQGFFQELAAEVKTGDVIFFQYPSDLELHHLYKKAEVFLFSSIYEGFGIPLLEALAHNTKSIVSDLPVFHEIGKKSIAYCNTASTMNWARLMLKVQKERKYPKINLTDFTWEKTGKITEDVFKNILRGKIKRKG